MAHTPLTVPWVLKPVYSAVALELLSDYFGDGPGVFSGAYFQKVGGRGDSPETRDVIGAVDALAVNALSVSVPAPAAFKLLAPQVAAEITAVLADIDPSLDLADERSDVSATSAARQLWDLLRDDAKVGLGPTTTSKLMARKRPRLIPIYDSVIASVLGLADSRGHWQRMQDLLRANDQELHHHAGSLIVTADLGESVEPLRAIDVVLWMHGKDPARSRRIAGEHGLRPPAEPEHAVVSRRTR